MKTDMRILVILKENKNAQNLVSPPRMKKWGLNLPLDFCRLTQLSGPKNRSVFQFFRFARSLANFYHF